MNQVANQYHLIVVYPQQASISNPYRCWNWFYPANQSRGRGEPAIIAGIVQSIEQQTSQWTIDSRRVYVAGISAGAAMSVILGATYPDIFAAIGVHSGFEYQAATAPNDVAQVSLQGGPNPLQQGQLAYKVMGGFARIVPTIVFHGTNDSIINPVNGDQVVEQWMQTDMLASHGTYRTDFHNPTSTTKGQVPGGHSYTMYTWNDPRGSQIQQYWKVDGMGHSWSGGSYSGSYSDPLGPDASLAMYTFFLNHPMQ
jgi:poly(hydroxyalkanoate) depolymerase family esterase